MPHPEREHELMIEVARLRRENERLDRTLASAFEDLHAEQRRAETAQEALAAARRECELWKQIAGDLYTPLWERGFKCEPRMNGDHISVCGTFAADNCPICMTDALAAPADGEEGTR